MWWHTVTHGRGSEGETGEWSGYPVPFTLPRNMVYPVLLQLMRTPRLPVVDWTDAPADLNGLVRFAARRNMVFAPVPSHFNWAVPFNHTTWRLKKKSCRNLGTYYEFCAWSCKKDISRVCPSVCIFPHYSTERLLAWWYSCLEKEITTPHLSCTIADACFSYRRRLVW